MSRFLILLFPALAAFGLSRLRAPWRALRRAARAAHDRMADAREGSEEEDAAWAELARLRRRSLAWEAVGPLAAGVLWAGAETLRGRIGGGFAWYGLGASQRDFAALAQLAAAGGVPLVSAVVALLADALAGVCLRAWDAIRHTPGATRRHLDLTVALAALLIAFSWGSHRVRDLRAAETAAPEALFVAAVNPRLPCIFSDDDAAYQEAVERLVNASVAASKMRPDLVVWPETSLWEALPSPRMEAAMADFAATLGAPIVAGSTLLGPDGDEGPGALVRNAAWLFSTNGVSAPYAKRHLVPFGEYVPLDETFPALRRLAPAGVSCASVRRPEQRRDRPGRRFAAHLFRGHRARHRARIGPRRGRAALHQQRRVVRRVLRSGAAPCRGGVPRDRERPADRARLELRRHGRGLAFREGVAGRHRRLFRAGGAALARRPSAALRPVRRVGVRVPVRRAARGRGGAAGDRHTSGYLRWGRPDRAAP